MDNAVNRSFAKTLGAIGFGAATLAHPLGAAMLLADTLRIGDRKRKYRANRFIMGTKVTIVALHSSRDAADAAIALAFNEIERLAAIFDRHNSDTPISHLNETGKLTDVPPELFEVMEKAQSFYHRSNGTFDATVLPVLDMLKSNTDSKGSLMLSHSDLDDALALVGSELVEVSASKISFGKSSMSVTLDGIGRGFIVDRASDILAAQGVENHLISAGGDIRARGESAPGQPWVVVIKTHSGKGAYPAVIQLKDSAVSTSGKMEFYFDVERSHYHVPIPSTSAAPYQESSVSVVASTVMEADALSTAAFAMDAKDALQFINLQKNSGCLISSPSGLNVCSHDWEYMIGN
ncbi:FAD:protein FMN transferase [Maridesulfovibrio sp.]|uniref:FAD:protein FMN transferase n=1 Tax=Maridesulfovibrio sp. TaxID=2795000 RepID=UPI0029F52165|nr:FAD:protein FMN transferase [Maridesulfovibrio sp.]